MKDELTKYIDELDKFYTMKSQDVSLFYKKKDELYDFFTNFTKKEREDIFNTLKKFNKTQRSIFSKLLLDHVSYGKLNKETFKKDFKNIISNKFRNYINYNKYQNELACKETYAGFYKGVVDRSLSIIKLNIDGKEKFFLAKGGEFNSRKKIDIKIQQSYPDVIKRKLINMKGTNHLILDLSNFNVYNLSYGNLKKVYGVDTLYQNIEKKYIENFKKELINYINEVYSKKGIKGIDRLKRILEKRKQNKKTTYGLNKGISNLHKRKK